MEDPESLLMIPFEAQEHWQLQAEAPNCQLNVGEACGGQIAGIWAEGGHQQG